MFQATHNNKKFTSMRNLEIETRNMFCAIIKHKSYTKNASLHLYQVNVGKSLFTTCRKSYLNNNIIITN